MNFLPKGSYRRPDETRCVSFVAWPHLVPMLSDFVPGPRSRWLEQGYVQKL